MKIQGLSRKHSTRGPETTEPRELPCIGECYPLTSRDVCPKCWDARKCRECGKVIGEQGEQLEPADKDICAVCQKPDCPDCDGSGSRVVKYPGCDSDCGCTDIEPCRTCDGTGKS